jgi:tetratricopeptide (TPR) repeat protein
MPFLRPGIACLFAYLAFAISGCLTASTPVRISPPASALSAYGLACSAEMRGDLDQAVTYMGIAITADNRSPELYIQYGRLLSLREEWEEASDAFKKALELQPDRLDALRFKAVVALKTGKPETAISDYKTALAQNPDDITLHLELAQLYDSIGKVEDGIEVLRIAREKAPQNLNVLITLGEMDSKAAQLPPGRIQGKREHFAAEAIDVLLKASEIQPENSRIWLRLVDLAQITGRIDLAIKSCRKVLELDPDFDVVRQRLAQSLGVKGLFVEAIEQIDILLAKEPLNTDFLNLAGILYWNAERRNEAIDLMQESLAVNPKQVELRVELGGHFIELERFEEAVNVMEGAGAEGLANPQLQYRLGLAYILTNRLQDARTVWDRYISLLKDRGLELAGESEFFLRYGLLLEDLKDWSAASAMFEKAFEGQPDNLMICQHFAVSLFRSGEEKRAREIVEHTALRVDAPKLQVALFKAQFALDIEDFARASQEFDEVISMVAEMEDPLPDEQFAQILFLAGAANERASSYQKSVDLLRRSIELDPSNPEALNYLGYMMADRGEDLVEARSLIEKALELSPENGAYLDSLAWALYRQGDLNRALELLLKARDLIGDDPVVHDHLGDVYWDLGQFGRARTAWNRALELDPQSESIQKKLEEKGQDGAPSEALNASSNDG